jgi:hypothetical protein
MQKPLSGDDQWYVWRDHKKYGPLHFSDLVKFCRQKLLLEDDWVWRPGLDTWIAAGKVTGLFTAPFKSHNEPEQINQLVGEEHDELNHIPTLKERALDQIRNFVLMFVYLWIVFGLLAAHESIILSQHQIDYQSHGLAIVNALIFAKVMLVAEDLRLGDRLNDKPLIYSILFKSLLFGIALISFHIVEHVLIGMWNGSTIALSISEVGVKKMKGIASIGMISTVALIPFFILREISRVIGKDKFWSLFFQRRDS